MIFESVFRARSLFPKGLIMAFAAMTALLTGPSAVAQDPYRAQVMAQLEIIAEMFSTEGYVMLDGYTESALEDGASEDIWLELDGGTEYVLVGVCDEDCTDVDLELFSSESVSIDSDYEVDDFPVVAVTPYQTQRYRIHVYMAACSVEPCSWGVGLYSR